jgi:predicted transposase/invertase (TIGR01784 family)
MPKSKHHNESATTKKRDSLHHEVFSDLRVAKSLLKKYLPPALVAECDWDTLRNETTAYKSSLDPDAHCDLLFSVRFRDRPGKPKRGPLFVNILLEHQSQPDPLMPFRILRYMVRIWERFLLNNPKAKKLPIIYPIVLHQNNRKWTAPTQLTELFDTQNDEDLQSLLLVQSSFCLIDLAELSFDKLRENIIANGLLAIMKAIEAPDTAKVLDPVLDIVGLALSGENNTKLLAMLLNYLFNHSRNLDKPAFIEKIKTTVIPEMKTQGLSLAEQFIAEGEERGRHEGLIATLERQLRRRFGDLPQNIQTRLQSASISELEDLTDAILDAESLQELFPASL